MLGFIQNKVFFNGFQKPVEVEVFGSPSPLPKDPVQRKQQLESLMDQISGSFSFMQVCITSVSLSGIV